MEGSPNVVLNERNQTSEVVPNKSIYVYEVQEQANCGDRNENNGYSWEEGTIDWEGVHYEGASKVLQYVSVREGVL